MLAGTLAAHCTWWAERVLQLGALQLHGDGGAKCLSYWFCLSPSVPHHHHDWMPCGASGSSASYSCKGSANLPLSLCMLLSVPFARTGCFLGLLCHSWTVVCTRGIQVCLQPSICASGSVKLVANFRVLHASWRCRCPKDTS